MAALDEFCSFSKTLTSSTFRINADYKKYGKCRLALSRPLDFAWISAFLLPKSSRFTSVVNLRYLTQKSKSDKYQSILSLKIYFKPQYNKGYGNGFD